jgi:hypothetical protein
LKPVPRWAFDESGLGGMTVRAREAAVGVVRSALGFDNFENMRETKLELLVLFFVLPELLVVKAVEREGIFGFIRFLLSLLS